MSTKIDENQNPQSANVLQLGFNISVSGDPGTNFQIVLDDKGQASVQSVQNENQIPESSDILRFQDSTAQLSEHEVETKEKLKEVKPAEFIEVLPVQSRYSRLSTETSKMSKAVNQETATSKDIIDEIKSTMEHFEKFSDHIKEVPRLKSRPLATSSPLQDRPNSISDSSLLYGETRPRRYSHLYDFHSRRDYFRGTVKPLPPDLFLKPLPAEGYYRKGFMTRYLDLEAFKHFGSVDNLSNPINQSVSTYSKSKYDLEKYDSDYSVVPPGILKKADSESGDKQSTSSADSVKDIKIYQSGGILIMQNFKDNWDAVEKKEISDFSAKLIENCNKLREEINSGFPDVEDERLTGNSLDEGRNSGKMVQFDLSGCENQKSKSGDSSSIFPRDESSSVRLESSGSNSDCIKTSTKVSDTSPQGTSVSQDLPSLSTQENDSIISNPPGMSPTYATSGKKLEWDSGADVGYLNLDLSKENLSTIERIVLKGLSSDGLNEKNVVYEKQQEQPHANRSKFILERMPSELLLEEVANVGTKSEGEDKITCSCDGTADKKSSMQSVEAKESKNLLEEDFDKNDKDESQSGTKLLPPPTEEKVVKATLEVEKTPQDNKPRREPSELVDKSVNVNTLFQEGGTQIPSAPESDHFSRTESQTKVKASKLSPKVKKLKKKRISNHRASLTGPLKDKIDSIIDIARCSSNEGKFSEMGVPKKIYKKIEANPEVELSRDMEEIIIDQRFKIKQSVGVGREASKKSPFTLTSNDTVGSKKDVKAKNRPISASSSSNNTVLPNSEVREVEKKNSSEVNKIKVSSVGIQAFSSEKSSVHGDGAPMADERKDVPKTKKNEKEINTSSKNIQAFGLNSSLPRELAHPKETKLIETQNTKGTQFFGGPVNSLPNYHSNLIVKPVETCGRAPQVLKTKQTSKTEIIRLNEENKKNAIDVPKNIAEPSERLKKGSNDVENKENLNTETSANGKRSHSRKTEPESNGGCGDSNRNFKNASDAFDTQTSVLSKEISSAGDSNGFRIFDEVSCNVLTSDLLKEHGHSIDRNIIQEKYFQSQLFEIAKREMTSKSTSMERRLEHDRDVQTTLDYKKSVNASCQYSPKSKSTSDREFKKQEHESITRDEQSKKSQGRLTSEQCDSSQNMMDEFGTLQSTNQEQDFGGHDSLQSSTQTAHSWIPGVQDSGQNGSNAVGRARSFEYLPGHIYESNGNLREELPSETERNLISCSSSGSSASEEVKLSLSKDSEGRNALVLENREETSIGSNRTKILNENLTQLDIVVSKLREKDAQIQCVTQSLLVNFWSKKYCGDNCSVLGATDPLRTEEIDTKDEWKGSKESENASPDVSSSKVKKMVKDCEISIGCQTEGKLSDSYSNKYNEEKKVLEKRISEGKESQIKWIENEIYHLNSLRDLLEKQSFPSQRRKKRSLLSITGGSTSKSEENYSRNVSAEVYSRSATPTYMCNVSLAQSKRSKDSDSTLERSNSPNEIEEAQKRLIQGEPLKYGMAMSLSGNSKNFSRMVMIPVGVQVTLKSSKNNSSSRENHAGCGKNFSSSLSSRSPEVHFMADNQKMVRQSDVNTQYPSLRREARNLPSTSAEMNCQSTSVQANLLSPVICRLCQLENCVCLNLTGKSNESTDRSFKSNRKITEKKSSVRSFMAFPPDGVEDRVVCNQSNERRTKGAAALLSERYPDQPKQMSSRRSDSYGCSSHPTSGQKHRQECNSEKPPVNHETPGVVSPSSHQSRVHPSHEHSVKKFECCLCSKFQVHESSNCHIIKIHGSKCCSRENGTCSSRTRSIPALKKTENQSCQTDDMVLIEEHSLPSSNRGKISKKREKKIEFGCKPNEDQATKNREPLAEKLPCQQKASYEDSYLRSVCSELTEESALDRKCPEEPAYEKIMVCHCKDKEGERKQKLRVDDHPRHYFLKIEEKEIDERDIQSVEERKSLEVITVTVPVKKPWKAKPPELVPSKGKSLESKPCHCCKDCYRSKWKREESKSERTNSPNGTKPQRRRLVEYDSDEDVDYINSKMIHEVECKNPNSRWSSPCENSQQNSSLNQMQSECSSFFGKSITCFDMDSGKFENEDDYDSHKMRNQKNENLYYNSGMFISVEKEDKHERCRKGSPDSRYRREDDTSFDLKHSRCQKYVRESGPNDIDYYNYNKREFMTKSELLKEKAEKSKSHHLSLQESLVCNRPDFYNNAESRRQIISERAKERVKKHTNRMECLINLIHRCGEDSKKDTKRIFTSAEMREQTRKRYKKLPEVTGKVAERKKKEEYRTNKIMADIFAKKLQLEALKGHINLSNSVSVLATI